MKDKKYKIKLYVSYSLCIALLFSLLAVSYKAGYVTKVISIFASEAPYNYSDNLQYEQRESLFETMPASDADVVFLGDSITSGCEWQELIPKEKGT